MLIQTRRPLTRKVAIIISAKTIIQEESAKVSYTFRNTPDYDLIIALMNDICIILFYTCIYAYLECKSGSIEDSINHASNEVSSDTRTMLDDLQVSDLGPGIYLDWLARSKLDHTHETFFLELLGASHFAAMHEFIETTVPRIYHELIIPIFAHRQYEVVDVDEDYGEYAYRVTVIMTS